MTAPSPSTAGQPALDAATVRLPRPTPVILRDGSSAWLRATRPDDLERLRALFGRASRQAMWFRFFSPRMTVDPHLLAEMADSDGINRLTLAVTRGEGEDERVLGIGSFVRLPKWDAADMAFFVDGEWQGKGIGTLLLERLIAHGRTVGLRRFTADTLADNAPMIGVFARSGLHPHFSSDFDVRHVEFTELASEEALAGSDARERVAAAASLRPFFHPRAVAVIGASRNRHAVGGAVFARLIEGGFEGPVYPINPTARAVHSVRAYASVLDVPDDVDLAVVAVPAAQVPGVVDDCVRKGVRALVVLSAGFAETGPEGRAVQDALLHRVRANGMRMVGPNCIGILNTAPDVRLNATFGPSAPAAGRVAMSSQSGALGLAILDCAAQYNLGLSTFVAVGNKADVSTNDLLQYWEEDDASEVIAVYVESFGNPRKFARIARRLGRRKPIVALKSGRSQAGSRAARSHTAALAGSDVAVEALFRQAGVIRVETLEDLFQTASVLVNQPLPAGRRVCVVTNAGGPAILAADMCEAHGLPLPALSAGSLAALHAALPATAGFSNPIDMIAAAGMAEYRTTVKTALLDPNVDALLVIFIPAGLAGLEEVAAGIQSGIAEAGAAAAEKPVVLCLMSSAPAPAVLGEPATPSRSGGLPVFRYPEPAAAALARVAEYAEWKARPIGVVPALSGVDAAVAREVVEAEPAPGEGRWLRPDEVETLLHAAGIAPLASRQAPTPEDAVAAAEELGFPVAVKAIGPTILHKTEVGGVRLQLTDGEAVHTACEEMRQRLGSAVERFLVQRMAPAGIELLVGVSEDPIFGPLIGFGLGGAAVEVLRDVVFRITPLTDEDARGMVRAIRGLPLLQGFRGAPAADLEAIEGLLLRISWLVEELPQIAELDLNPVIVSAGQPPLVVDARIRVHATP